MFLYESKWVFVSILCRVSRASFIYRVGVAVFGSSRQDKHMVSKIQRLANMN